MCPSCWALRSQTVQPEKHSGTRLQTTGLVLGILSILPFWPLVLSSLVVNIVAIVKAKEPPARDVRWRPIVGLCLTCLWIVVWVGMAFLFAEMLPDQ